MTRAQFVTRLSAVAVLGLLAYQASRPKPHARPRDPADAEDTKGLNKPDPEQVVEGAHHAGRHAQSPWQIPRAGWIAIAKRSYQEFSADRVLAVAAGCTFYALLAIFPAVAAFVSLYGLAADRATLADHLNSLSDVLPAGGIEIISAQLTRLTSGDEVALGFGFLFSLALALWSANAGIKAMFDALNVAYDETEKRGFVRLTATSLLFTAGAILFLAVGIGAVAVVPLVLGYLGLDGIGPALLAALRWPALLLVSILAVSALYRFGPSRENARWEWISPGGLFAGVLWIVASVAFSWYAANFASYNETYGTLGAVIGFMTWMWLSTAIILFGAELNAEAERQTSEDSTTGSPRPRGQRGAVVADEVAS